jgi:PAS domain S-box-containing protein
MSDGPRPDRSPDRVSAILILGAAVAFLGGVLFTGRYLGALKLVTVPGRFMTMQDNTAVGFVLAGLAVMCHDLGRRRLAFLCGALAAGLGSVVLAEQVAGRPFAVLDMLLLRAPMGMRMAPATALGIALAGALVLVHTVPGTRRRFRRSTSLIVAGSIVAMGLVGLATHDLQSTLASLTRMDVHSALAFLGLGVAFFLMVGKLRTATLRRRIPAWMPWFAGAGVGVLVLGIWVGLTADEERWRRLSGSRSHEAVMTHATGRLRDRLESLERLALLLGHPDQSRPATALEVFLEDMPAVRGAVVLDAQGAVLLARGPAAREPLPWAQEQLLLPEVQRALERSAVDRSLTASEPIVDLDDIRRLYVCVPLPDGSPSADRLLVGLNAAKFFDGIFDDAASRRYQVELSDGYERLYWQEGARSDDGEALHFEQTVAFGDRMWTLQGAAWPSWLDGRRGASNTLILWIGVFLAVSIAFAVRKSEQLRQRATSLEEAKRTIEQHAESVAEANARLEERADSLRATEDRLRRAAKEKRRVLDSLSAFLIAVDGDGVVTEWNFVSSEIFGLRGSDALGKAFDELPLPWDSEDVADAVSECVAAGARVVRESVHVGEGEELRTVSFTVNPTHDGARRGFAIIGADVTERQLLEVQLHSAQKLESVGTLAAGIAHEINTPMQFVGDNVRFVAQALGPLSGLLAMAPELRAATLADDGPHEELAERMDELLDGVDAAFVVDELPLALDETLDGIERVTTIVRAMKDFSHPGSEGVAPADVNQAVVTTLAVARNEYKYIADVETELGDLPQVECWIADLNQVFLNLLVNGTHAIRDRLGEGSPEMGVLRVVTRADGDMIELRFSDTGTGIPEEARKKVFDQFFTTKEIGRGTGMGLSICRSVVVEKHGGTLDFETELGVGTTFVIRLPLTQEAARSAETDDAPALR